MLMIGLGGDKNKIEHDGYYEDTYVKTPAGWKFKSRIHHATYDPAQKYTACQPASASRSSVFHPFSRENNSGTVAKLPKFVRI